MQRHGRAVYRGCREALRDSALADDGVLDAMPVLRDCIERRTGGAL